MDEYVTRADTPIGALILRSGLYSLNSVFFENSTILFPEFERTNHILELAKKEIKAYFDGSLKTFTVPLNLEGTNFQKKCWETLLEIPYGQTISYKEQAIRVGGGENYARAVASANNKNPFPVLIPCHRVIGSNGCLVGYAGGIDKKERLLFLENKNK